MEGAFGRQATNPRSAPSSRALGGDSRTRFEERRFAYYLVSRDRAWRGGMRRRFFERDSWSRNRSGRAYSSVGLERTPDKREVGGSNPPRPTSFRHEGLYRGCSSIGRAPALQAGCRRFDSDQLHWIFGAWTSRPGMPRRQDRCGRPKLPDNRIRRVKKASTSVVFARFTAFSQGPGP